MRRFVGLAPLVTALTEQSLGQVGKTPSCVPSRFTLVSEQTFVHSLRKHWRNTVAADSALLGVWLTGTLLLRRSVRKPVQPVFVPE